MRNGKTSRENYCVPDGLFDIRINRFSNFVFVSDNFYCDRIITFTECKWSSTRYNLLIIQIHLSTDWYKKYIYSVFLFRKENLKLEYTEAISKYVKIFRKLIPRVHTWSRITICWIDCILVLTAMLCCILSNLWRWHGWKCSRRCKCVCYTLHN